MDLQERNSRRQNSSMMEDDILWFNVSHEIFERSCIIQHLLIWYVHQRRGLTSFTAINPKLSVNIGFWLNWAGWCPVISRMKSYQFSRSLRRSGGERGEKRSQKSVLNKFKTMHVWKIPFGLGYGTILTRFLWNLIGWWVYYGELEMYSFWTNRLNGGGR